MGLHLRIACAEHRRQGVLDLALGAESAPALASVHLIVGLADQTGRLASIARSEGAAVARGHREALAVAGHRRRELFADLLGRLRVDHE